MIDQKTSLHIIFKSQLNQILINFTWCVLTKGLILACSTRYRMTCRFPFSAAKCKAVLPLFYNITK